MEANAIYSYFQQRKWRTPFYLAGDRSLFIHWSDWHEGQLLKSLFLNNEFFEEIEELKYLEVFYQNHLSPVHIDSDLKKATLYDYYQSLVAPQYGKLNLSECHISLTPKDRNFVHGTVRPSWFDGRHYLLVLYEGLLDQKVKRRKLRLHFRPERADLYHGPFPVSLTDRGFLFIASKRQLMEFNKHRWLDLKIDLKKLYRFKHNDLYSFLGDICSRKRPLINNSKDDGHFVRVEDFRLCQKGPKQENVPVYYFFVPFEAMSSDRSITSNQVSAHRIRDFFSELNKGIIKEVIPYL